MGEAPVRTREWVKWAWLAVVTGLYALPILFRPTYSGGVQEKGVCYQHGLLSSTCDSTRSGDCVAGNCIVHQ
jgi:hypothetical protein